MEAVHGYNAADLERLFQELRKMSLTKLLKLFNNIIKEPEMETQDLKPALPRQKRKRTPSVSSADDSDSDEDDTDDAIVEAFK